MQTTYQKLFLPIVMASAVGSCAGIQQPVPRDVLAQLKPGMTTMAEAEAALGPPEQATTAAGGDHEWIYYFAPESAEDTAGIPHASDRSRKHEIVRLVFSPAGVLIRHEASRSALGVRDASQPATAAHDELRGIPLPPPKL